MSEALTSKCSECSGTGRIEIASRIDQVARGMLTTKSPERHRPSCAHNNWPRQACRCGVASRNRLIEAHLAELIECAQLIRESVDD